MTSIYLNGKFTAQRMTGVQRVAARLVQSLDARLSMQGDTWVLLCPRGAAAPATLQCIEVRQVGLSGLPLHVWEQCVLPLSARGGLLVNLAGSAPFFARRQACLVHDAAVFDFPQAYTRGFVAWYRSLFRRLARSTAKLMTVSSFSRLRLAQNLGTDPSGIAIVRNGGDHLNDVRPDERVLADHGLTRERYLLAVASANPSKNLDRLLMAYARLGADPAVRLVIVGGRNERVFAAGAGQDPPGVIRTGPLNDAQLKALYLHAIALVFPSLYEGFGLPPLEAMGCGCPVAASDAAAIPEVCGDAALYFDPNSVEAIAQAMQRLLTDEALRDRLREAGRARAAGARWTDAAAALHAELRVFDTTPSSA